MKYLSKIEEYLKTNDFSFFKKIIDEFFSDFVSLNMSFSYLEPSKIIYRTRPYKEADADTRYADKTLLFQGYDKSESGVSPTPGNNRYSDTNVSCFYGSFDLEVSIYEVYKAEYPYYSVATSCIREQLKMIDISSNRVGYFKDSSTKHIIDSFVCLVDLLNNLNEKYYKFSQKVAQYFMNMFKSLDLDGLMYDSYKSNMDRINVAIFNAKKIDILGSKLKKIDIDFSLENMKE